MNKDSCSQKRIPGSQARNPTAQKLPSEPLDDSRFAGMTKQQFVQWLSAIPTEDRYLTLRVRSPSLTRSFLAITGQLGESWRIEADLKKHPKSLKAVVGLLQTFIDGLVLMSDQNFLDSLGFDFNFVANPEKLYDHLCQISHFLEARANLKQKGATPVQLLPPQKQNWLSQVLKQIEASYFMKSKQTWDLKQLQRERRQKKDFGTFWKNLGHDEKLNFLYLGQQNFEGLLAKLASLNIQVDRSRFTQQISQVFEMDKKQICNRIFKVKVKKCPVSIYMYYETLYELWRSLSGSKKVESGCRSRKKRKANSKREKSLGSSSNETNETDMKTSQRELPEPNIYDVISEDILELTDKISEESNRFFERRVLAFERVSAVFRLYGVECKVFGSCASGIAIQNSDVDIAIDQKILKMFQGVEGRKNQMNNALQFISEVFGQLAWVTSIKVIKTAAIPIIKLTIDTGRAVDSLCFTEEYREHLNREIENSGEVQADLTIETTDEESCTHLGIVSTARINTWLEEIPTLRPLLIILKNQLARSGLNETYLGGLNTYSLVVLLVAGFYQTKMEQEVSVGLSLGRVFKFLGELDEGKFGVDIRSKQQVLYRKEAQENKFAQLQIKDPLNQGKVMTKNCYEFEKIKQIILSIYQNCYEAKFNLLAGRAEGAKVEAPADPELRAGQDCKLLVPHLA